VPASRSHPVHRHPLTVPDITPVRLTYPALVDLDAQAGRAAVRDLPAADEPLVKARASRVRKPSDPVHMRAFIRTTPNQRVSRSRNRPFAHLRKRYQPCLASVNRQLGRDSRLDNSCNVWNAHTITTGNDFPLLHSATKRQAG
jgi:hypothetical protein